MSILLRVVEGYGSDRVWLQQAVIARAVGSRLHSELQRLGDLKDRRHRRLSAPVQDVDYVSAGDDLLLQCLSTSGTHRFQPIGGDHQQDVDELAVSVGMAGEALAKARH
ncbi:MAG TPA: hypothetical protein VGG63_20580 [Steroidobacteraceae bacterium]|jgi:hypothetical protein